MPRGPSLWSWNPRQCTFDNSCRPTAEIPSLVLESRTMHIQQKLQSHLGPGIQDMQCTFNKSAPCSIWLSVNHLTSAAGRSAISRASKLHLAEGFLLHQEMTEVIIKANINNINNPNLMKIVLRGCGPNTQLPTNHIT